MKVNGAILALTGSDGLQEVWETSRNKVEREEMAEKIKKSGWQCKREAWLLSGAAMWHVLR